jgi:hypothetical protein
MDRDTLNKLTWAFIIAHVVIILGEIYFVTKLQQEHDLASV